MQEVTTIRITGRRDALLALGSGVFSWGVVTFLWGRVTHDGFTDRAIGSFMYPLFRSGFTIAHVFFHANGRTIISPFIAMIEISLVFAVVWFSLSRIVRALTRE